MKKLFPLLLLLLLATTVLADVPLKNEGVSVGNVLTLDCVGPGISCSRSGSTGTLFVDAGGSAYTGTAPVSVAGTVISCVAASGVAGGCLTTAAQNIAGPKTFNDDGVFLNGLVVGDGGMYWDGGVTGVVRALKFVAEIAGNGTTAFECRNQTAASSPCINNPSNIMELFTTPPDRNQANSNFPDFLFLSQAPDGGRRVAGYLLGVLSGPSSAELPEFGVTHSGGIELNLSAQGGVYTQNANAAGQAADMVTPQGYWRRLGGSVGAGGPAFIDWQNVGTAVSSGNFYEWYNRAASTIASITYNGGFISNAASGTNAFGATVNGARTDFGAGASDHATSDGTTVTFAGPTSSASNVNTGGVFTRSGVEIAQPTITSATSIGTILTANFELGGIRFQAPATFTRFGQTTLVTGVGAGNLTIQVYNVTGAAVVCTRTLACGLALGMSSASCSGTVAAADDVVFRIDASACTTSPVMALTAMYR